MKIRIKNEMFELAQKDQGVKSNLDNALNTLRKTAKWNGDFWETESKNITRALDKLHIKYEILKETPKQKGGNTSNEYIYDELSILEEGQDRIIELLTSEPEYFQEPEPKWEEQEPHMPEWAKTVKWHCTNCGYSWTGGTIFECPRCHHKPSGNEPVIRGLEFNKEGEKHMVAFIREKWRRTD